MMDLIDWIEEYDTSEFAWYVKRLAGNDTLATNAHQAGPYVPKPFMFELFPALDNRTVRNPRVSITAHVDSHPDVQDISAIYYNSRFYEDRKNGRNEIRLTGFGGRSSAVLDPESTGSIAMFVFSLMADGTATDCHVWVCRHETEEDIVEDRFGPVEPQRPLMWTPKRPLQPTLLSGYRQNCWLSPPELPAAWLTAFPTGAEIVRKAAEMQKAEALPPDRRLLKRRDCEFEIFRSVEAAIEFPIIQKGFATIDDFIGRANTVLQRRKARAGRSLELHARQIFMEEELVEGKDFSFQPVSEVGKRPDFLFPSQAAYQDPSFPSGRLRMLAAKTTCKDRWRQIMNEADRVSEKHLLTLQEGVSENQFQEMTNAGVKLVVPKAIISKFPKSVRPYIQDLESFIGDVRLLSLGGT